MCHPVAAFVSLPNIYSEALAESLGEATLQLPLRRSWQPDRGRVRRQVIESYESEEPQQGVEAAERLADLRRAANWLPEARAAEVSSRGKKPSESATRPCCSALALSRSATL